MIRDVLINELNFFKIVTSRHFMLRLVASDAC